MAMYEETQDTATTALESASSVVFTADTIAEIIALATTTTDTQVTFDSVVPDASGNVTVAAGAEVVYVVTSDTAPTNVVLQQDMPVVVFQGAGGVIAEINDGTAANATNYNATPERVIVGSAGADNIVIADGRDTKVIIGGGDSVVAGSGETTIVAGAGNCTITGGTGNAIVQMTGSAADYTVTVVDGRAVVTNNTDGGAADISNIQFVQLDGGEALIFANDANQTAIATLYETIFGRTAEGDGLNYWFDFAANGATLNEIANRFMDSPEANAQNITDAEFVNNLYTNTFSRAGDAGGIAYWNDLLASGAISRADCAASFSYVAGQNVAGTMDTEASIVGNVTIITNII